MLAFPGMLLCSAAALLFAVPLDAQESRDAQGGATDHAQEHPHHSGERFLTDRESPIQLELPDEEEAFSFVVFGDRTGGTPAGVQILAQAVREVNWIGPDLVMTVGDLVQGYNTRREWLPQAAEFSRTMNHLRSPWFPVAGNHDIYWRGAGRPPEEHESDFEKNFGPLWYAFEHKDCWFIVLHSDEADPATGVRDFNQTASQRMSPRQFQWLQQTLEQTQNARHIFVFVHHPRWLGGKYGTDWEKVHQALAQSGKVRAVFAGHIHRMTYSGLRDGIEYLTLATTGGSQPGDIPAAGYLHHYNLVTVRDSGIDMVSLPVGQVANPRSVSLQVTSESRLLADRFRPRYDGRVRIDKDFGARGKVRVKLINPSSHAVDWTLSDDCSDPRWYVEPDHRHGQLAAGQEVVVDFAVRRIADPLDAAFQLPHLRLQADYLAPDLRVPLPERRSEIPTTTSVLPAPAASSARSWLQLDGRDDGVRLRSEELSLPAGPFSVEAWFRADAFAERQGLINKTEGSEFGFFLNHGTPEFLLNLGGRYVAARGPEGALKKGRWYHIAGVWDGAELRLYLDGKRLAAVPAKGKRKTNTLPLYLGADVDGRGRPTAWFAGALDEVRISRGARYSGESFRPKKRLADDDECVLMLHMDALSGPWLFNSAPGGVHPRTIGKPEIRR